ncbi:hypothetical protein mRhiFer1_008820 [Rhinolophus ferrumequinum]|uniref:Uncharacterized protein n=1 Tax=Rhinolophus ferrumequinum TaxID=59479 RepID=A0A7J8AFH7_RHIFE|nr:hypothetical protein mRhiFer1_008820 [Rhinolophus ferrumequinum]
MHQKQSRINYNRRTHTRNTPGTHAQEFWETAPLRCTEHILHKATQQKLRDIGDLFTQKQTQRGSQNEETKKHVPIEEQKKTPEIELNKMEAIYFEREFITLLIRMLKELRENSKEEIVSIKKDIETIKKN